MRIVSGAYAFLTCLVAAAATTAAANGEHAGALLSPCPKLLERVQQDPVELEMMYKQWANKFGLGSRLEEQSEEVRQLRMKAFLQTLERVVEHNHRLEPASTYKLGLNQFSDLSDDEFHQALGISPTGGLISDPQASCSATSPKDKANLRISGKKAPESFDWREKGIVTPVKNQGHCGSCWTFSTTGAVEAHFKKVTGVTLDLSEQQLIDCAQSFDNHGCNGGLPSHAFEYIKAAGGIEADSSYPYKAADQPSCLFDESKIAAKVVGEVNITQGDEKELRDAIAFVGPVSITFQVYGDFRSYASGVYKSTGCGNRPEDVNHAVLAVGYGTDKETGTDYWIVKNSWGPTWGDQGYFKIQRGVNMCGVAVCNSYPIVKGEHHPENVDTKPEVAIE